MQYLELKLSSASAYSIGVAPLQNVSFHILTISAKRYGKNQEKALKNATKGLISNARQIWELSTIACLSYFSLLFIWSHIILCVVCVFHANVAWLWAKPAWLCPIISSDLGFLPSNNLYISVNFIIGKITYYGLYQNSFLSKRVQRQTYCPKFIKLIHTFPVFHILLAT